MEPQIHDSHSLMRSFDQQSCWDHILYVLLPRAISVCWCAAGYIAWYWPYTDVWRKRDCKMTSDWFPPCAPSCEHEVEWLQWVKKRQSDRGVWTEAILGSTQHEWYADKKLLWMPTTLSFLSRKGPILPSVKAGITLSFSMQRTQPSVTHLYILT